MAEGEINSVRTKSKFCKHEYIWIVDPFGSVLKKLVSGECHLVTSPLIQTWWHDQLQVELQVSYYSQKHFYLVIKTSNTKLSDRLFDKKKTYFYRIILLKSELTTENEISPDFEQILHSGAELEFKDYISKKEWEKFEALKLQFEISVFLSDDAETTPVLLNLKNRLTAIKDTEELLDFSIFVGEEECKVSKAVLALASPVFLAMFSHEFKEKETQTLHIDDVGIDTVRRFVDFIYTSEPPFFTNLKSIVELLHMADKYEVLALRKLCLAHIYLIYPDTA